MVWWLVPAGTKTDKIALRNVSNTLENPYDIESSRHLLDEDIISELKKVDSDKKVHVWGAKEGQNNRDNWKSLQRGDKIIFYTQGKYMYLGTVYCKLHDYELAKEIWPPKDVHGAVFEYIYFMIDVQKIDIDGKEFNNLLEYGGSPRGFNTIASERVDKLVAQFGSVENALESLMINQRISSKKLDRIEIIEDDDFQSDIENTVQPSPKEDDKPKEKPNSMTGVNNNRRWKREASVALRAVVDANYKCEVNASHFTFTSKSTNKPYVEAHHLIPMHTQDLFNISIDVPANIVSLCPNCHRILHHALMEEKKHTLELLYNERKVRLENCNINISFKDLLGFYN